MALGTLASRLTGFVRTLVIGVAIGVTVGDAYNAANTIPNIIYELLLGGVLTSVVVPLLVARAGSDPDGGEAYAQRLLTLVVVVLGGASLLAVVLAPWIIHLYIGQGPRISARGQLATLFARFFLPQILFYGIGALLGAILNARGSFARPMWAPVLNNVVVIATGLLFMAVTSPALVNGGILTTGQQLILAIGTTLGIVAQTVALLPALRETGFRLRLRWGFRGVGLSRAGGTAGWVLVYVLANQAAFLVITRLAWASHYGGTRGGAFTVYTNAFILVLLPHSVVAVSVITALLPQMSREAMEGRLSEVAADLAGGLKLAAVLLVPAALAGVALGPLIGAALFAHRSLTLSTGRLIGATLAAYSVSLLPFSAFQLQLRAFYALQDTRTPALINIVLAVINVLADAVLFILLPAREQVVGLALGYSLSYFVGFAWFTVLLERRLGRPPAAHVTRTIVRLTVAAGAAVGAAGSLVGLVAGAAVGTPLYVALILRMRVPEVRQVAAVAKAPWKV